MKVLEFLAGWWKRSCQLPLPDLVALESEASHVFLLKQSYPVEIAQKCYRLCLNAAFMVGTIVVCQRQTVTTQHGPEASSVKWGLTSKRSVHLVYSIGMP